jgi:hypothetical protein
VTDERADREEAIRVLRSDRERTAHLLVAIDPAALETPGLGGGDWSPKDLVGHLESCEEDALEAIDAWARGERAPITRALETIGVDEVNRRDVDRKAALRWDELRASAASTHAALLEALASADDAWWGSTEPAEGEALTRGQQLGDILGGSRGPFRHDADHWDDLLSFAQAHPAS